MHASPRARERDQQFLLCTTEKPGTLTFLCTARLPKLEAALLPCRDGAWNSPDRRAGGALGGWEIRRRCRRESRLPLTLSPIREHAAERPKVPRGSILAPGCWVFR